MRITTQMLNETAKKAGIPLNTTTLLDYINKDGDDVSSLLSGVNGSSSSSSLLKAKVSLNSYEDIKDGASELEESVSKLADEEGAVFEKAKADNDTSELVSLIEKTVENYNSLLEALQKSTSSLDIFYAKSLKELPESVSEELAAIGITINKDGTLEAESEKLKKADIDALENIFGSSSEFTEKLLFVASRIENNAEVNIESVGSTYSQSANILSSYESSKYDFLG